MVKNQVNYISQNFVKPNIVMYFSPNLVKNYSHNFFPQNVAQFFSQNLVKKFTPQKFTKKMALKITKFGENLVTKFSFTNFGDILVHFIFTKFGDSLKFSPNLVNIFSIFFSPRTLGLLPLRKAKTEVREICVDLGNFLGVEGFPACSPSGAPLLSIEFQILFSPRQI